jgi:hypothetical protein
VYAKVAGCLEERNADIGQQVDAGTVLGTVAVPEVVKSRECPCVSSTGRSWAKKTSS